MTAEQKRELWLKRMLPALAIMVIYFALISQHFTDQLEKAQTDYESIMRRGVSEAALPGIEAQKDHLTREITQLKESVNTVRKGLTGKGLIDPDSDNVQVIEQISELMDQYHLRLISEDQIDDFPVDKLPVSLRDTQTWVNKILARPSEQLRILEIRFNGDYQDTFAALTALVERQFNVIPVSLTMEEDTQGRRAGRLLWVLKLWV